MTRGQALAVLGLDNRATLRTIKKAYRAMAKLTHPDKLGGSREKWQPVLDAYEFLTGRGQVTRPQPISVPMQWVYVQTYGISYGTVTSADTTGGWCC